MNSTWLIEYSSCFVWDSHLLMMMIMMMIMMIIMMIMMIIMMIMKIGHGFDYFSDADLRGIKGSPHVCQYLGGGWGLCLSWEWFIWEWYFDLFVFARTPPFRFLSGIEICESSLNGEDLSMWIEGPISKATTVPPVKGFLNTYGWDR